MGEKRKEDGPDLRYRYRADRLFEHGGKWFFTTREGFVEGPFENQSGARHRINAYIQIMTPDPRNAAPELVYQPFKCLPSR